MRTLTVNDLASISGGYDNKGYNFSNILDTAFHFAIPAFLIGIVAAPAGTVPAVAGLMLARQAGVVGAGYAVTMMGLTVADNYFFPAESNVKP